MYGYVFDYSMCEHVNQILATVYAGKKKSVQYIAMSMHEGEGCGRLWNEPRDHMHMIVYFSSSKPTDTAFHKDMLIKSAERGVHWEGERIRVPTSIEKYIQCEPRKLKLVYGNAAFKNRLFRAFQDRHQMKTKIENRDAAVVAKKKKTSDNDWWIDNGQNPEALQDMIFELGIKDVSNFLDYAQRYMPEVKFGGFVYDYKRDRLEKQINEELRRRYSAMTWWEAFETRRKQFEDRIEDGTTYDLKESIELFERILMLNRIDRVEFIDAVFQVIEKKHAKKNCLYLYGESNSMKSTIATSIRAMVPMIGMQITSRDFGFQECHNVNLIFNEECRVVEETINEVKRIYEGAEVLINIIIETDCPGVATLSIASKEELGQPRRVCQVNIY